MNYRVATQQDTDDIVVLLGEMMKALGQNDLYEDRYEYAKNLIQPDTLPILAYHAAKPVGLIVVVYYPNEQTVYIGDVVVQADYRNQGIGTHLIEIAEIYAHIVGAEKVRLSVWEENLNAQRLYDRLGYRTYSTAEAYIEMEKSLLLIDTKEN